MTNNNWYDEIEEKKEMRVYIATRLVRAAEHNLLRDALIREGHEVTYDWTVHCSVKNDGEDRLSKVADDEAAGVTEADLVVVLLPGGRGTHCELGMAVGAGVPLIIHNEGGELFQSDDKTCAFYWHNTCEQHTGTLEELIEYVLQYPNR